MDSTTPIKTDAAPDKKKTFQKLESKVRGYCRTYTTVFKSAKGAIMVNEQGRKYIDFLAGAGTLNYGHNDPVMKRALVDYLIEDGVVHGLDMHTTAKHHFLEVMSKYILQPREMHYKMQFTGPTGTNAVEAAFKLARKITDRSTIVAFTNAFHGVTLGSVAATANSHFRDAAGVGLDNVTFMPYDCYMGDDTNSLDYFRKSLEDSSSGLDLPAAVIVETVQGEGGVNVASVEWLRELAAICREHDILLIIDDIQMGCGRTGTFFSFEEAGIEPDIITLSKSLSGYGLPFSLVLMNPRHDQWEPGEHNGTFRGHNLAFVTAAAAIKQYWSDKTFSREIMEKSKFLSGRLHEIVAKHPEANLGVRGRGLIFGVECEDPELAATVQEEAFKNGLIIETCGSEDQVVKFLPALNIDHETLAKGIDLFEKSLATAVEIMNDKQEEGQ